jgi:hypothetical protein
MEGMRIGKLIDDPHDVYAVPKNMTSPLATKVKYAALAAVPVALVIGAVLKAKKARPKKEVGTDEGSAPKGAEGFSAKRQARRPVPLRWSVSRQRFADLVKQ